MAKVAGGGAGSSSRKKYQKMKMKKYVPTKAAKPLKKKANTPNRVASSKLPGYKVPSKLLKNTKSNRKAGLPSLAKVLRKQEASIKAYDKAHSKAPAKKAPAKKKPSSDWQKGMDYMKNKGISRLRNK